MRLRISSPFETTCDGSADTIETPLELSLSSGEVLTTAQGFFNFSGVWRKPPLLFRFLFLRDFPKLRDLAFNFSFHRIAVAERANAGGRPG